MASERVMLLNICCWIGVRGRVWGVAIDGGGDVADSDPVSVAVFVGDALGDESVVGLGTELASAPAAAAAAATCRCTSSFNTRPSRPVP